MSSSAVDDASTGVRARPVPGARAHVRRQLVDAEEERVAARCGCALKWSPVLNGLRVRYAEAALPNNRGDRVGTGGGGTGGPLVLLLHGWPESWYSWRHQLRALRAAGYHAVAPDMRGYGGTAAACATPGPPEEFSVQRLCGDALALVHYLGYSQCVLVGHDFGAWAAWQLALLHPAVFGAVCCLSVPYAGRPRQAGLLTTLRAVFGDERRGPTAGTRFNYMLHHQLPEAPAQYEAELEEALYCVYTAKAGDPGMEPPPVTSKMMYVPRAAVAAPSAAGDDATAKVATHDEAAGQQESAGDGDEEGQPEVTDGAPQERGREDGKKRLVAAGMWKRLPRAKHFPAWLSEEDLAYYVRQFEASGMGGPLNWYRALDISWSLTPQLTGAKVAQPVLFIAGTDDMVIAAHGGADNVRSSLERHCNQVPEVVFLDGVGHWVQQESHEQVSAALVDFVQRCVAGDDRYRPTHRYSRL